MATCNWPGITGASYAFEVYPLATNWNHKPGLYIYASETNPGAWMAHYIGQTDSFQNRLPTHEKHHAAVINGATHIHARVQTGGEAVRKAEELDLIRNCQPPCNDLLK